MFYEILKGLLIYLLIEVIKHLSRNYKILFIRLDQRIKKTYHDIRYSLSFVKMQLKVNHILFEIKYLPKVVYYRYFTN